MKIFRNIYPIAIALLFAWACTDPIETVISANPNAPSLTAPVAGATLVLDQESGGEMITFTFVPADFGFPAAVTYTVQIAETGTSFENPLDIGNSSGAPVSISQSNLNQRLIARGYEPDEAAQFETRVRASLGTSVEPIFSELVTILITPYLEAIDYARMYVPGDYQGWNPANENTVIFSVLNNNIFEGYVHILSGSGAFKVNEGPSWDVNYGGADGNLVQNGPDLVIGEPFGTFRISANLNNLTYTIGDRRRWGIIGNATPLGWDNDTPMNFDPVENVLTITLNLTAGEFKFRAGDWAFNYGDTGLDGILNPDGANIPIPEAGNYTITMDWKIPGEISYEVIKN